MSGAPSQTLIVNKTLAMLGTTTRILSIIDGSPAARLAEPLWDLTRDEVLADHPWNFAIFRTSLAIDVDVIPSNEFAYAYALPPDCLRWLPWEESHADYFYGEQEGRHILSNHQAPIYVRCIRRIEDIALWSPGFIDSMAAKLAQYMAKGVTGQSGMIDRMRELYLESLPKAKRQDGLATGRQSNSQYRSNWLHARRGGEHWWR